MQNTGTASQITVGYSFIEESDHTFQKFCRNLSEDSKVTHYTVYPLAAS
jgi:hypothetical protein